MAIVKDLARPQSIVDQQITATGDSYKRQVEITPSDSTVYSPRLQAIVIGTGGTLEIVNSNGDAVSYSVVDGQTLLVEASKVMSTGTTATGLVGWS